MERLPLAGDDDVQQNDNDRRFPALSCIWQRSGADFRPLGFDSGWSRFSSVLVACIEGGDYLLETGDGRSLRIPAGCGFVLPAGLARRVRVPRGQTATTVYAHLDCRVHGCIDPFAALAGAAPLAHVVAREVARLNRQAASVLAGPAGVMAAARLLGLGGQLLTLLFDAVTELGRHAPQTPDPRLLRALRFIDDHLADPLSREGLARHCGCSVSRLHTLFKQTLGKAPMDHVVSERLNQARQLLLASDLPVQDIARRCGYRDPFFFSRAFRRSEGCAPSAYRRTVQATPGT